MSKEIFLNEHAKKLIKKKKKLIKNKKKINLKKFLRKNFIQKSKNLKIKKNFK